MPVICNALLQAKWEVLHNFFKNFLRFTANWFPIQNCLAKSKLNSHSGYRRTFMKIGFYGKSALRFVQVMVIIETYRNLKFSFSYIIDKILSVLRISITVYFHAKTRENVLPHSSIKQIRKMSFVCKKHVVFLRVKWISQVGMKIIKIAE